MGGQGKREADATTDHCLFGPSRRRKKGEAAASHLKNRLQLENVVKCSLHSKLFDIPKILKSKNFFTLVSTLWDVK